MMRVDRLTEAPIVGRFYLVPMVYGIWYDRADYWPVIGSEHKDVEFFHLDESHYHIDGRFLNAKLRAYAAQYGRGSWSANVQSVPLSDRNGPLPKPVLKRRKCLTTDVPYEFGEHRNVQALRAHYAGQQCAKGKGGWVCPHRKASLGSLQIVDGVITCPLHGLRIDAATGKALRATSADSSPVAARTPEQSS